MASKVLYKQGTKATYLGLSEHLSTALYFCTDTCELFKGDDLYSDGMRLVDSYDALPTFAVAADGILYFCKNNGCGYVLNEARDGWIPVIHGVDQETLEIGEQGLMRVRSVPVSKVTDFESTVETIVEREIGELSFQVDIATAEKAGIVKPGPDFTITEDGTLGLAEIAIEKVTGLSERLSNIEMAQVGGVHYRGSVPTIEDLPEDAQQGDLYEVTADNSEWCWNGEKWFEYGKTTNLSPIATAELDEEQFEIDEDKILHLIGLDAALVNYRGDSLRAVLDALSQSCNWEDMGVEIDPANDDVAAVVADAADDDVLEINAGSVAVPLSVTKSATMRGASAGLHQNFAQEVR